MKQILFIIGGLILFNAANAQVANDTIGAAGREIKLPALPFANNEIVYRGTEEAGGYSKELLYNNGLYWLKNNIESPEHIRIADKSMGRISGVGKIMYNKDGLMNSDDRGIYFDFDIHTNDGVYEYSISRPYAITGADKLDYSEMYQQALRNVEQAGKSSQQSSIDTLSEMHNYITLWISAFKTAMIAR